jgi:hypothetical protein
VHETMGQDDAAKLRDFLHGRDVPCPVCRYNLRDFTGPACPECRHEIVLTVGVTRPRFLWFLLAMIPCGFSGIAAAILLLPIIMQPLMGGGAAEGLIIALDLLGWLSAMGGLVLIRYRFVFLRQAPGRQRALALAAWGMHILALLLFFATMLIIDGGP